MDNEFNGVAETAVPLNQRWECPVSTATLGHPTSRKTSDLFLIKNRCELAVKNSSYNIEQVLSFSLSLLCVCARAWLCASMQSCLHALDIDR